MVLSVGGCGLGGFRRRMLILQGRFRSLWYRVTVCLVNVLEAVGDVMLGLWSMMMI